VLKVLLTSISMDSGWNNALAGAEEYFRNAVARLFNEGDPLCLVVSKGNRLIAASLLDPDPGAMLHLVSGPAVLMEYRNRGIGTRLLHASLCALRDRGFSTVAGITRLNTTTARYVYPKFKGVGEVVQLDLAAEVSGDSGAGRKAKA
jgi:GNAT superfamily N-acetyltransferase